MKEAKKNPYIGFVSFQHCVGDPLYTDSVVNPKGDLCETEDFECYPVPPEIEEKGDSQGFYPDSTVAYYRFLWKDFEPERGKYNYDLVDEFLRKAEKRGQKVMIRLMPHSTCARDDVPAWLKEMIPCPERPPRSRFKDSPTDPLWIDLMCEAVLALGARFDSDPTLYSVDISTVGAWGEGHKRDEYPDYVIPKMVDTYIEAFPTTILLCQITLPKMLERIRAAGRVVGIRADAMGQPAHREEVYPMFLSQIPSDIWKTGPVSGEAFWWLGEWKRQNWDPRDTFDYMLGLHMSTFNGKYLPIPFDWKDEVERFESLCGYHYSIASFEYPDVARAGEKTSMKLTVDNVGVAPIYHNIPLKVRISNGETAHEYTVDTDIRKWLPGLNETDIEVVLPEGTTGNWKVEIAVKDEAYPDVYFATDAPRNGTWYEVGELKFC